MPITQDRMLALIHAAQDFQQAWKKAQSQFDLISMRYEAQEIDLAQAWNETAHLLNSNLQLDAPIQSNVTIATEVKHFQHARARNVKTARWQRERRANQDKPRPVKPSQVKPSPSPQPQPEPQPQLRLVQDPDADLAGAELDLGQSASLDYIPAQSEEDLISRLDPEARARIEAELGLSK